MTHDGNGAVLGHQLSHSAAQAAQNGGLFGGDNGAGFPGCFQNQLRIQGLDGVHIDDAGGNALCGQNLPGLAGHAHHDAGGDDRHVAAVGNRDALPKLKLVVRQLVGEDLGGGAGQTEIGGAVVVQQGFYGQPHFVTVAGANHSHAGDLPHQGQVFGALMGGAVLADGDAAVGADDLDVQMGIGDGVADLLVRAAGSEDGEGVGKGLQTGGSHARGNADHVILRDAAVEEALGISGPEVLRLSGHGQVCVQDHQLGVLLGKFYQGLAVGSPRCNFPCHIIYPPVL